MRHGAIRQLSRLCAGLPRHRMAGRLVLGCLPLLLAAAAPEPSYMMVMAMPLGHGPSHLAQPAFQPAPVPSQDDAPNTADAHSAKSHFGPALFAASHQQFRGDGFTAHSTEQIEQERNFRPGGGFALKMPLQ